MFTGLVEEIGKVESVVRSTKSSKITIRANEVLEGVKLGDSIATNGVCLTVNSIDNGRFSADVMAETIRRSNLRSLAPGDAVNLERALRLGDRLGAIWSVVILMALGPLKACKKKTMPYG